VSTRRGWLGNAAEAANLASARPDAWLPGSLCALGYLAWLPLLVTVAGLPSRSDLAFTGARLFSSGSFPFNVLLLASLSALLLLGGCLVVALGEAASLRAGGRATGRSLAHDTEAAFSILLLAALPAVAALAAIAIGIAVVAPGEFGAPDLDGPVMLRIGLRLLPLGVVLLVAVLLGQAFGAVAVRGAFAGDGGTLAGAMRAALGDLVRNPLRRLGVAATGTAADLVAIALALALLRVLWAPIRGELAGGGLVSPQVLILLVGFVAVWLALVLLFGALHAWTSNWWSLELAPPVDQAGPPALEVGP